MLAREIMSHPVVSVRTSTGVAQAAELLADQGFTAMPVLDDDDRLVGIVSEVDLIRGRVERDPRRTKAWVPTYHSWAPSTVGEVMSTPVESLTPGADVADAVRMMVDERIRCLPIVDGATVVGILTRRDVLRASTVRDDRALERDIVRQLRVFDEPDRWTVSVQAAVADVADYRDSADDRAIAHRLAAAVPGVVSVQVRYLTSDPF